MVFILSSVNSVFQDGGKGTWNTQDINAGRKRKPKYHIMGHTGKHSTKTLHGISSGAAGMRSSGSPSPQDLLAKPCHSLYTSFASTEPNNISEV